MGKMINEETFEQLYMSGYMDTEIASLIGCAKHTVTKQRDILGLPSNRWIFTWQRGLKPSEFEKIPEKYRDRRLVS